MGKSIFDIHEEYLLALENLENYCAEYDTDEVPDEIQERLYVNANEVSIKLDGYHRFKGVLDGQIYALDAEIKLLEARKKGKQRTQDRIKELMAFAIKEFGKDSKTGGKFIETEFHKYTFVKTNPVIVSDISLIPDEYVSVEIKTSKTTRENVTAVERALTRLGIDVETIEIPDKYTIARQLKNKESGITPILGAKLDETAGYIRTS